MVVTILRNMLRVSPLKGHGKYPDGDYLIARGLRALCILMSLVVEHGLFSNTYPKNVQWTAKMLLQAMLQ